MGTTTNQILERLSMSHDVLGLKNLSDFEFLTLMKLFGYDTPTRENQLDFDEERRTELLQKNIVFKYFVCNCGYYYLANHEFDEELFAYREKLEWIQIGGHILFMNKSDIDGEDY